MRTDGAAPGHARVTEAPPSVDGRIVATGLTKVFGDIKAVDGLSFTVEPGSVTGFLGPNGAGKTTTLRMILGLGGAHIRHRDDQRPALRAPAAPRPHCRRRPRGHELSPRPVGTNHLRVFCAAAGLPDRRADEVLDIVGLTQAARYSVGGFSLGMRQRLGLATALLGNPRVLLLDEPANGLDPEGIAWLRGLLRYFADVDGRTVLVSSHVLSEVEQTVDRVVIIARGRLIYEGKLADLEGASAGVVVRTPTPDQLSTALAPLNVKVTARPDGAIAVVGATPEAVGRAAWQAHVELHELRAGSSSLEETFLRLTADAPPPEPPA